MSRRHATADDGALVVEFALLAPLVFALLAFAITLSMSLTFAAETSRVAELAARAVSLPSQTAVSGRASRDTAQLETDVRAHASWPFDTIELFDADGEPVADPSSLVEGDEFRVRVTRDWSSPLAAVVAVLSDAVGPDGTIVVERTGVRE